MPKKTTSRWGLDSTDLLITFLPSIFIVVITVIYFLNLQLNLDMLVFLISPIFITYFVIRNVRLGSQYNWLDWLSIVQYSILFIIGFYSVCNYFQQLHFHPVVNAAIFLGLVSLILVFIMCIAFYCFLYKYERIALSKQLYKKQLYIAHEVYKDCYQAFLEVKSFISFSYKLTAVPPQNNMAKDKLKQQYRQMLTVQKNLLAKKKNQIYTHKFYLSQILQSKIDQLFQSYQQLFVDCPTVPEEIQQFEIKIDRLHQELEQLLTQELGVDFLYKEIQLAIKTSNC